MNGFIVKKQVILDAAPTTVWNALTDPKRTKKYFFNCEVHSDWKAGSPIVFKGKLFLIKKIELYGRITKIDPGKYLQYTLHNKDSKTFSTITEVLTYKSGKTTLSVTDHVGEGEGFEKRYKRSDRSWDKVLRRLKKFVERRL
jgi:uncharacterized protein YndB with AHSA1/START domain